MALTNDAVLAALKTIKDPVAGGDIATNGVMRALNVEPDGTVRFVLEIDPGQAAIYQQIKDSAEAVVSAVQGVTKVSVVMTGHAEKAPPPNLKPNRPAQPKGPDKIPGVSRIIAIASGKGGVGKSTVSANLACALAQEGLRVGLLDADIFGPSQPRMMGVSEKPQSPDGKQIIPLKSHGVTMMSIGLMVEEARAVVWRGPMLMSALQQLMMQVQWGELDVLVVDLPPGTGDVQMTLAQKAVVDGAVIVCTPQDVALLDARKGIDMFRQLNVPIIGMIENMSTHICSNCGHEEHVFGHGGVAAEADKMGVPLLGEVPLDLLIRVSSDEGVPVVVSNADGPQAHAFRGIARKLFQMSEA